MTNGELHDILDDENKKISLKEFRKILWELKEDCFEKFCECEKGEYKEGFYSGEQNAFYIALDLSEHIEE